MRFGWLTFLFFFVPFFLFAQNVTISGVVTSNDSKKPLPHASVFLSRSSVGTSTAEDGSYTLSGVRAGQYTIVVTTLGYEEYDKTILIGQEPVKLNIGLTPKPLMLKEVVISPDADWKKNYEAFKRDFIGTDENARYCEVINPRILNLTYNPAKQTLHADADEFLIVDNNALGYRVKFLLKDFTVDNINNIVNREGEQVFEELPGSRSQKRAWRKKREQAYYGSAMHFYRSLYTDNLQADGFIAYTLKRSYNPLRPKEEDLKRMIKSFSKQGLRDSLKHYIELENLDKWIDESLVKPPLTQTDIFSRTSRAGIFGLHFDNYLYVVYTKKTEDFNFKDIYRDPSMPPYQVSVVTPVNGFPEFDTNGIVVDNYPLYEGSWSKSRLSDMLPVDYVPGAK
jgi:hypothetical protein